MCITDELKQIKNSYKRSIIDEVDVIKLLNKLINHKCCKQCLIKGQLDIINVGENRKTK